MEGRESWPDRLNGVMPHRRGMPGAGAFALLVLAAIGLLYGCEREESPDDGSGGVGPGERVRAEVVDVVDGDTIEVTLDGATERVRYIGVDTPESVAPDQPVECFGHRASAANARLVEGEEVQLLFDRELRDAYGRLLAYVYVGDLLVNAELIERGLATTLEIAPNTAKAALFERLELEAGRAGRGLWGAC
jgi:micrococcal nuclease